MTDRTDNLAPDIINKIIQKMSPVSGMSRTASAQIRDAYEDIVKLKSKGFTLAQIADELKKAGVEITASTLKTNLSRIKKSETSNADPADDRIRASIDEYANQAAQVALQDVLATPLKNLQEATESLSAAAGKIEDKMKSLPPPDFQGSKDMIDTIKSLNDEVKGLKNEIAKTKEPAEDEPEDILLNFNVWLFIFFSLGCAAGVLGMWAFNFYSRTH